MTTSADRLPPSATRPRAQPPPRPGPSADAGHRVVHLPAGVTVLAPTLPPGAAEPALDAAVDEALRALPPRGRLTVLVNDPQRHTASRAVLGPLARRLAPGRMRLLIASGAHTTPPGARLAFERALCGEVSFGAVAWHDSRSDALVPIGAGNPWRGHPWLLDTDGVLAVGSVEPHYFAGWTGAHKTATVGAAAHEDIRANHAAAMDLTCRPARLAGSGVAEGIFAMLAALEASRPVAAVDLVQAGPRIFAAAAGGPRAALDAAIPHARRAFVRHVDAPADAVVAEVAGPLAETFYQADKGIKNHEWAVRDRGCLVLVAPCPGGLGQDDFVRLLRRAGTHADAVHAVRARGYRLGDHKAVRLRHLTDPRARGVRAFLVSEGLSAADAGVLGMTKAPGVPAALAAAGIDPARHHVLHVRDAGNLTVLPDDDGVE